jgi:hypothetical protein
MTIPTLRHPQEMAKDQITLTAKENLLREKESLTQALQFPMIVKFLQTESSCASVGKLDVAQPRSNQASVAWWDITCAGRNRATSFTRATNAHTDLER